LLTSSGWVTHTSGHPSAEGRACNKESSPGKTNVLSTATPPTVCATMVSLQLEQEYKHKYPDHSTIMLFSQDSTEQNDFNLHFNFSQHKS